ncbi:N-acetylglucosaminyl-phosphatidylinositol de-N-acetylase [Saitoella coloradoensis]
MMFGTLGSIALACALVWIYTLLTVRSRPVLEGGKKILVLIAHPDDEAMFFAPTMLGITNPSSRNDVRVLCLSTGNSAGLGKTRARELEKSCQALGVQPGKVESLDHPALQDSMSITWDPTVVSQQIQKYLSTEKIEVDVIITFDTRGISSHPNHKSCLMGAKSYASSTNKRAARKDTPISLYTLTTTSLLRKYAGIIDSPFTLFDSNFALGRQMKHYKAELRKRGIDTRDERARGVLVYMNSPLQLIKSQRAMRKHESQMVWFRWGWIFLSRYMVLNDLRRVSPVDMDD